MSLQFVQIFISNIFLNQYNLCRYLFERIRIMLGEFNYKMCSYRSLEVGSYRTIITTS